MPVKTAILTLALGGLAIFLSASGSSERKAEAQSGAPEATQTVAAAKAVSQNLSRNVVLTAEFIPFQEVEVMAKVAGYVKEIQVDVGDHVLQGPGAGNDRNTRDAGRHDSRASHH